ncbi:MAG TPA: putative zinc-binding metallopeptidase [Polyangiales bacterium]|nr:putative zinc-binding metallopeptidase [Polyangiales bacterium]
MKLFTCACGQVVFFESKVCTACNRRLAFLPESRVISALEPAQEQGAFVAQHPRANGAIYRLCLNEVEHGVCSWAVAQGDDDPLCFSCRLNQTIPDLGKPTAKTAWSRLEVAKRRMLYTLLELGLPIETHLEKPEGGLAFAFMESRKDKQVFTGQDNGLITINLDEADDPRREKTRQEMGEAYRTLVGHFRHEIGHFYWDQLIKDTPRLEAFRQLFGDETFDYQDALDKHYKDGAPQDWPANYVSEYATMHPWEDWAETWAHYLHMIDTIDTACSYGLVVGQRPLDAAAEPAINIAATDFSSFDSLIVSWLPLTLALNSLDRSMGHPDSYPFVLTDPALTKLRFVHDVVCQVRRPAQASPDAARQNDACAPAQLH